MDREELKQRSKKLKRRQQDLKMPDECLAMRSGVPVDRLPIILFEEGGEPSFVVEEGGEPSFVFKIEHDMNEIAIALGLPPDGAPKSAEAYRNEQARIKAEKLTSLVQGSSALEGQDVSEELYQQTVQSNTNQILIDTDPRRLWTPL